MYSPYHWGKGSSGYLVGTEGHMVLKTVKRFCCTYRPGPSICMLSDPRMMEPRRHVDTDSG